MTLVNTTNITEIAKLFRWNQSEVYLPNIVKSKDIQEFFINLGKDVPSLYPSLLYTIAGFAFLMAFYKTGDVLFSSVIFFTVAVFESLIMSALGWMPLDYLFMNASGLLITVLFLAFKALRK